MSPTTEVDLTSETPPRKMKQALLPFGQSANRQNASPKTNAGSESGRKRKLSGEENIPLKKAARTEDGDSKNIVDKVKSKSKLAQFAFKDTNGDSEKPEIENKESSKKKGNKKDNSNLKQKEKRVNKEGKVSVEDGRGSEETSEKKSSGIHGLLVNPLFKKTKKSKNKEVINVDEDSVEFELLDLESSNEEDTEKPVNMNLTEAEDASITSMTEEWAKFHENNDTDQSMEEMETSAVSNSKSGTMKKTKEDKAKDKEEKLRKKQEEKALKEEEKAKAKAEKEKQKQIQKEEKEKKKEKPKEESKAPATKVNPLARFLAKAKEQKAAVKPETVEAAKNDDVEIVEVKEAPTLRTSPRKKIVAEVEKNNDVEKKEVEATAKSSSDVAPKATSTPLRTSPRKKVSSTPKTPFTDPARAQEVNIAKLKVQIHDLNDVMDKAVEEKDFLKAHETKESIKKLEEEIKSMEADTSYVSQSLEALNSSKKSSPAPSAAPKTPKTSRNVSVVSTPGSAKAPNSGKKTKKEILEQEKLAKKEALEKEKLAKKEALEKEKLAKKEAKEKERAEKEKLKEIEKKAKEEEKLEKERLKKEEKEKAEAEKLKMKQEKEEEKMRKKAEKEAEAKQKEEEKKLAEEAEKEKAKKEAQAFSSFFKKVEPKEVKESVPEVKEEDDAVGGFTPFRVKKNMRLAPLVRGDTEVAKARIDSLDMPCGPDGLYLELLKNGYQAGKQGKTWPYEKVEEDDVEILDEDEDADDESDPEDDLDETNVNIIMRKGGDKTIKIPKAKLLKFHENRRPAYWGTWTKQTNKISGRRPFGRDEDRFDYEEDSDDDWEEEEEGESLSDDEKDKEDEEENDDYEVDNEFFVPHGHLSDDEEDREEDEVLDPETAKQKQKLAAKEFEKEHKKKTQELKPRLWGTYWTDTDSLDTGAAALQLAKILGGYSGIVCASYNNPIDTSFSKEVSSPMIIQQDDVTDSAKIGAKNQRMKNVPEEAIPDLIKLVHGNCNNKIFLAREFIAFWNRKTGFEPDSEENATPSAKNNSLSKKKVVDKIQEIAEYKKKPDGVGRCWMVKEGILSKHEISNSVLNDWSYILDQPNKTGMNEDAVGSRPGSPTSKISSPAPTNLITKFARPLTEEEKEEQKAKLEREAAAAKQKRDAAKAEQAAVKAEQIAKLAAAKARHQDGGQAKQSPLSSFTQALSEMQKKGQLSSGADKKTPVSMSPKVNVKKVALTTVTSGKNNPITAITSGKGLSSPVLSLKRPSCTPSPSTQASPIAIKRKPGLVTTPTSSKTFSSSVKASPIAIRRKPKENQTPSSPSQLSFSGMIPDGVGSSKPRTSPRKKPSEAECITIEDSN